MEILIPLFALFAPFFVWPIEMVFPFPFIIEELAKAVVLFFGLNRTGDSKSYLGLIILAGFLFSLSETVIYIFNYNLIAQISYLLIRFAMTSSLHIVTFLLMYLTFTKKPSYLTLGLITSMLIHYLYNLSVVKFSLF